MKKRYAQQHFQWNKRKKIYCTNCDRQGHVHRICPDPITSFGIIAVKKCKSIESKESKLFLCDKHQLEYQKKQEKVSENNLVKKNIFSCLPVDKVPELHYFMVQRRNTMGFVEFVRGKYDTVDLVKKNEMIKIYLEEMTCHERHVLATQPFDRIWGNLWMNHNSKLYINTFNDAKQKFKNLDIQKLLDETECKWTDTEFGFPKGRKNFNESNIQCAIREFREESGFNFKEFKLQPDLGTVEEVFTGTNGIKYKHVYYIAFISKDTLLPKLDTRNINQAGEIKHLGWYNFDECQRLIRSYDVEKKKILHKVHSKLEQYLTSLVSNSNSLFEK